MFVCPIVFSVVKPTTNGLRGMRLFSLLSIAVSCAIVYGDQSNCHRPVSVLPTYQNEQEYSVRLSLNCENHTESPIFCEDSGWGDEEATVVCKNYYDTDNKTGYSNVSCKGDEETLGDCEVGNHTLSCSSVGIARCLDVPQVFLSKKESYDDHSDTVSENETAYFCVTVRGPLSEPLNVLVETIDSAIAAANFDYIPLSHTVTFESTESVRSQQCLEIELIDDSLAEYWEMFSVTLSTNSSSSVNITRREFNIFIAPNDGECTEGNVTGSTNDNFQLVEMCSGGVWSPICDEEWTPQDITVACRELGYQDADPDSVIYEITTKTTVNTTHISCSGNETSLRDCVITEYLDYTVCRSALVDCSPDTTEEEEEEDNDDDNNDGDDDNDDEDSATESGHPSVAPEDDRSDATADIKNSSGSSSTGGIISGVVVTLVLVLVLILTVVVIIICFRWRTNRMAMSTKQLHINELYQSQDMLESPGDQHLDNPVYGFGGDNDKAPQPQMEKDTEEHQFLNPLYFLAEADKTQRSTVIADDPQYDDPQYAVPENKSQGSLAEADKPQDSKIDIYTDDPQYAVPEKSQGANKKHTPEPVYAYAET